MKGDASSKQDNSSTVMNLLVTSRLRLTQLVDSLEGTNAQESVTKTVSDLEEAIRTLQSYEKWIIRMFKEHETMHSQIKQIQLIVK